MRCVCGQLRGVTLERNSTDYETATDYDTLGGGKIVADGVVVSEADDGVDWEDMRGGAGF